MKKFIAIMISLMLFVSLFAGLQITASADTTDPVWLWDLGTAEGKNAGQCDGTKNNVTSSEDWATVTDNDGDGMIYPAGGATAMDSFAAADAKYLVVKLRVTTGYETAHRAEFISHNGTGHGTVAADVAATEGWQYASASTEGVGNWSGTINWVRIDPVNCSGCVADVDWVAFFADEASAEAFVAADKAADAPEEGEVINLSDINAPGEYKLAADVTGNLNLSSGDYVIDLNGHTWTNSVIALNVRGANVTIIDSVGDGAIISTTSDCIDIASGSITLTGATAIALADGMDAIFAGGGKVVTNDATLFAGKAGINAAQANVDITVNSGIIGGVYEGEAFVRTAAFELRNNAKIKLNGQIMFAESAIIRRDNHTNTWAESFIVEESMEISFGAEEDTHIGEFFGSQYYKNTLTYEEIIVEGESADFPLMIYDVDGTFTVQPGQTLYVGGYWAGMNIIVTGEGEFSIAYNGQTFTAEQGGISFNAEPGMGRMPVVFALTNSTDTAKEYTIVAQYPEGTMGNPEEYDPVKGGTYVTELEEGNFDGYYYEFTAEKDGSITLRIESITEGVGADIIITATGEDFNVDMKSLSEDGVDGKVTINYKAGDLVVIQVFAEPDANWNIPAATVVIEQVVEGGKTGDFGLIALAFVAISSVVVKKKKEF